MKPQDHHSDELFMKRALELARLGIGQVSPNPRVGCVVVHNGIVISEGWHQKHGEAHAEVNAIAAVHDQSLLKDATVYVNLEPCSHQGKTPPCADLLIKHQVKKVVVSNLDSNPLVSGQGIKKLRAAGIEVVTGMLEQEGRELNKRFFTFMEKQRPYIVLKWAETSDGFIARENHDSKWISNAYSRQLVHQWRTEEDAVMVGSKTASHDNPQLNVRDWTGRNPVRVVLDRFLRLSDTLHVFDRTQKTLCYNVLKHEEHTNLSLVRIEEQNFIQNVLEDLYKRKIQSVVVEGGATILQTFIDAGLWDEAKVFVSDKDFGKGIQSPRLQGNLIAQESVFNDTLRTYHPIHEKNKHS
jgi:diaminohydroxyphosphoribosylaminopyrimidine deaminase / 5-amino-6-(5-phosphoribosylamino)uracil reductase